MSRIKIKNFGPIKSGYQENDGWIDIKKLTVFIGNQGSGKSTVAKLISTFTWLEKALVRGELTAKSLNTRNKFIKHFAYQNIGDYFYPETELLYQGDAFFIAFGAEGIKIDRNADNGYSYPKIMYVPAERNFVSAVSNVSKLKGLPSTLYTFSDEYLNALSELKGQIELPINKVKLEYQKTHKITYILGDDYRLRLSAASSGFQSLAPLYLVTKHLSDSLKNKTDNHTRDISIDDEQRLRKEIQNILNNPSLSDDIKKVSLEVLSAKITPSSFINIVEEPEQNLYPTSQHAMLNTLVGFNNATKKNKLIITTHSPYLINYISIAIKAHSLLNEIQDSKQRNALEKIIPVHATISKEDLLILELNEKDGTISKLGDYDGIPSDSNKLNDELAYTNELFAKLFELEQKL